MPRINVHVAHHDVDLVDDGLSCRFDAQDLAHLHDRVRFRRVSVHPFSRHAGAEAVAFNQERVAAVFVGFDNGTRGLRIAAYRDFGENAFDGLDAQEDLNVFLDFGFRPFAFFDGRDINSNVFFVEFDVLVSELEFLVLDNFVDDIFACDIELESTDSFCI